MSILDVPFLLQTRRNHALEHATIHVLERKFPNQHMAGHSSHVGFIIMGKFNADDIRSAVTEAMSRLRAGEHKLAIHAGCGTNFAATTVLSGMFAWIPLRGAKSPLGRLWLQEHVTTEAELGGMQVLDVVPIGKNLHRVATR